MKYYLEEKQTVLEATKSSEAGLSSKEAESRLQTNGKNKLDEPEKASMFSRFMDALKDPMIFLLLGAAVISTGTTLYENMVLGHNEGFSELFIILFVVVMNTVLSILQESKAEQAIEALMEMTAATSRVLRDGSIVTVKSEELVVGDVVILEAGDAVPADCRILESHSMKVEEAALTGESVPVNKIVDLLMLQASSKDITLGDRLNMVYSGSTVVYGRGLAVVTDTGMNTEMGKIADALSQSVKEETPLQKKLRDLSITLTKLVVAVCLVVFAVGVVRDLYIVDADTALFEVILDTFIISVALAVAAIPEGLPAVTTIILSIGVTSMSKRNALIRKLTAVETLGCTQIICSDKTGTLTQNRMTVVDTHTSDTALLAKAMALCSDALRGPDMTEAQGEPTECALVNYAYDRELRKDELDKQFPRVGEAPFDSGRKMMSTLHEEDGRIMQYTKGACEILLERCTGFLQDGEVHPMTEDYRAEIIRANKEYADRALRVLGAGYRSFDSLPDSFEPDELEHSLVFIGFVGMIDPCRPEVYEAINDCRNAGILPIMITGDHKDTAVAIAKDLGIITDASQAIEGSALDDISDEELIDMVEQYRVYARVQPEHKARIIRAWKAREMVTAMTGDGVNDAPSIKAADIGIAMGITGTAVTKSVSDMVLADDNFATIVTAVKEGRRIYDNVRKVVQFQLTTNLGEIVAIFFASMMGFKILTAAHLLWINLVTDSAPGLALGMEKAEANLMSRKPRPVSESLFANSTGFLITQGILMGVLTLCSYFIGSYMEYGYLGLEESIYGMTMAFFTCNFVEMFCSFNSRSLTESLAGMKQRNNWLWGAMVWTVVLTCGVAFVPALRNLFELAAITPMEFVVAIGLALAIVPASEVMKFIRRQMAKAN